ncbi:hypothetical protein EGH21_22535 [Halomicroarcula sp. F13]|uniref:Uncharacterized protein n=1 Tax=Haloarcula rubra TaxID=2487747 RepID=A0AAW4Q0K9_9EURY|nr:hypothetical protein [Halomicroarcula rubra]MBX0325799.1 hypothetical protein [Halomicroarcula rubra]
MTVLNKAVLVVEADVDGDGTAETGEFHMSGNLKITPSIRTGYLIGGRGSTVNSVASSTSGSDQAKRQGFYLDLGGGARLYEIEFDQWEGSDDQWGNTGDSSSVSQTDATGAAPMTQLEVLMEYLAVAEIDSRNPATLRCGEHHANGLYDELDVAVEGPQGTRSAEDGSWWSGNITLVTLQSLEKTIDGASQTIS